MRIVTGLFLMTSIVAVITAGSNTIRSALASLRYHGAMVQMTQDVDRQADALTERRDGKCRVARELADGRLSLAEAAARFRELCRHETGSVAEIAHEVVPHECEEEYYCRRIIAFVEQYAPSFYLEAMPGLADRLKAELAFYQEHGFPPLPEESAADEAGR